MSLINMNNLLKLIGKSFPDCYYSILEFDVFMHEAYLPDGEPLYQSIDRKIKSNCTGYTIDFKSLIEISKKIYDVVNFFMVVHDKDINLKQYNEGKREKYINDSLLQLNIDDGELIEINCRDQSLEVQLKKQIAHLPAWVECGG